MENDNEFKNEFKNESKNEIEQKMSLGDRMKTYEATNDYKIPITHYYCVRLDGHKFSKFTKGFEKPFDENFSKAMVHTAYDALCEFSAMTAYTHSDEITLIFGVPNTELKQTHMYNGRIQKITSLYASFVSTRFNYYLKKFINEYVQNSEQTLYNKRTIEKVNQCCSFFDARILSFQPEFKHEILNHIIWRSKEDCYRNAVQAYAYKMFSSKKLMNLNCVQMVDLIEATNKIVWNDVPLWQKHGIYIKKQLVDVSIGNNIVQRSRMFAFSFKPGYSDELLDFLLQKNTNTATAVLLNLLCPEHILN
ncbi:MAG: tRNA guanylyltransferase [Satyrvirus sp.]|uniref:tRNA guanylyltransferase n=1 Tax=Satyrvirus sp. TaxID=2487771 RepID=A0A3G5AJL5_9VIRU|nr:MAG: tRNA guanylyltransferase [Satyrvirus sp.]